MKETEYLALACRLYALEEVFLEAHPELAEKLEIVHASTIKTMEEHEDDIKELLKKLR
jgi:hypothetical protein